VPNLLLPSLTKNQVQLLVVKARSARDKAIISIFTESGLRLCELANIKQQDMDWEAHTVRVIGKGSKEAYAPFGSLSEKYLMAWLEEHKPEAYESVWGLRPGGIQRMLRFLAEETGLSCNPHTFRRTFACLLRKQGLDSLTIKDLGRWESLEMCKDIRGRLLFKIA